MYIDRNKRMMLYFLGILRDEFEGDLKYEKKLYLINYGIMLVYDWM